MDIAELMGDFPENARETQRTYPGEKPMGSWELIDRANRFRPEASIPGGEDEEITTERRDIEQEEWTREIAQSQDTQQEREDAQG